MRRLSQTGCGGFWLRAMTAGVAGMLLLVSPALRAQSAEPVRANDQPVREIYVPIGDLDVLLGGDAERVFVTREEYQDLLARTRQPEPSPPAARDVVVLSADYDVALSGERAVLSGRLQIDVLTAGLQAVSIPLEGVGLRTATLDDAAAVLGRDEAGVAQLFLEGLGRHELVIEATMPVVTSAAQQAVTFRVPTPAATRLRVSVPGNVEIRSGVLTREFDAAAGVTRFEVPPARGSQQLVMSLNNRTRALQRVVTARSVLVDEVTQGYRRLHATVSLRVLRGVAPSFSFRLPADLEVTDVAAPQVSQWRVFDTDSGRVLEVQLHEPTADLVTLAITASGSRLGPGPWVMQQIEPLEVAGHVALLGLLLDERLEAQRLEAVGAFPIDVSVLRQAVPASVFAAESSAPQIRPVAAWLAAEEAVTISAELTRPEEVVEVKVATLLSLEEQQQRLRSTITLRPQAEPIQAMTLRVPSGWDVTRVLTAENVPLAFTPAIGGEPGDVRVRFAQQLPEGASTTLTVDAESVPAEWLTDWQEQTVAFPMLTVAGGTFLEGAVAVTAGGDLTVRPAELDGLIPLARREREEAGLSADEGTFAYRVVTEEHDARLTVMRRQPQLTARTFTFARIGNEALSTHAELLYDIDRAATRQLSFRLPRETPSVISLRGLGGVKVSEFSSREDGDTRIWTAELADRARGRAGLAIDFQQSLSVGPQPRPLPLPCVVAEGVSYQSAAVAVEGHPEIDVSLASAGRRIDVGELVDAEYQVGRRLLGVFGFVDTAEVTATIARRAGYPLPEAIVQRAELMTLQGATGAAQTVARLLLRTNAAFLQVTLPSEASLWSVSIDGRPALPQRDGDGVLVSLPPASKAAGIRDLSIVYETESPGATWWQEVAHEPPKLAVRDEKGPVIDVPVADVVWQLVVPDGMRVVRSGGSVTVPGGTPQTWPLSDLLAAVVPVTGGIRAFSWGPLIESALPQAASSFAVDAGAPGRSRGLETADEAMPAAMPVQSQPANVAGKLDQPAEKPQADSGPVPPPEAPSQPATTTLQRTTWAFEGVRSLPIALEDSGTTYRYESFGGDTRLAATLVDERRIVSGAVGLVAVVALCGLALVRCRWKTRLIATTLLLLAAVATPVGIELCCGIDLHAFFEPACLVAVGWLPVFAVLDAVRFVAGGGLPDVSRGTMAVALLAMLGSSESLAEEGRGEAPIPIDMERLLETLRPTKPVAIPDDAVVIPYDPQQPSSAEQAEKVLVPYEEYTRLKKLAADMAAGRQPGPESPPAPYAFGGARYAVRLEDRGDLVVTGRVEVVVYAKGVVDVPLSLAGGVLASATLDDRPARLRLIGPDVGNAQPQAEPPVQQRAIQAGPSPALAMLALEGVGRHELAVDIRFSPSQRGGWRRVEGSLPVAPATAVSLTVPAASTEVRLGGIQDQAIYETSRADEVIDTALQAEGLFSVEWRSRVAAATIDEALTVDSLGIFDVREDGLQLTWRLALDIRQGQRDTWRLLVPAEVLVEEVRGSNVRGWETSIREGRQQIDVTLLEPATGQAELIVRLSREANLVFDSDAAVTLPFVSVPEAALHQGSVVIRRGPLIDLRVDQVEGLSREETPQEKVAAVLSVVRDESPLPLRPFQTYRFPSEQASLRLTAGGARAIVDVEGQTLVRIAERETRFEALLACSIEARPLHDLEVELPPQVELQAVGCPGLSSWSLENGGRLLRIELADGALGRVPVTLRGRLGEIGADAGWSAGEAAVDVAPFIVRGARRQLGEVVVQADPSLSVATTDLVNAETIPLSRTFRWLSEPQRALARLALLHRGASFSARLQVARRQPVVSAVAVTNVRITPRDIEETMLLRFRVREAGIRDVAFLVAESMADAEVETPLLLEKQVEPVADEPGLVRVRLTFQDDVMGSLAVLLQNSRPLPAAAYEVPMARIETGTTQHRYAVVETGGRDEVVVAANTGFRQLNRQAAEWRELVSILPGQTSMAYVAQSDAADPLLELSLRERAVVEAAGARIGLAMTTLSVDAQGEYRGSQEYRVDNKTEQLLEVQLPPGATLWSAMVAGESVKPTPLPAAADGRHVGVPLIKTQAGDLDYGVVLTYGGNLGPIDNWQTVGFPLMTTRNINVEQSQVRLWLPKTHRWFEFGGTLRQADSADDLLADFMAYQNKKIEQLLQVASSESNDLFSRVRASTNARQLGESLRGYRDAYRSSRRSGSTTKLQKAIEFNDSIVDEAKSQETPLATGLELNAPMSNSLQLRRYFGQQDVQRGQNVVNELGANFDTSGQPFGTTATTDVQFTDAQANQAASGQFNRQWFAQNRFGRSSDARGEQDREAGQLAMEAESRLGDVAGKRLPADPEDLTADFKGIERKLGLVMDAEQAEKAKQQLQQGRLAPESQLRDQVERYQQRLERQSRGKDAPPPVPEAATDDSLGIPVDSRSPLSGGMPEGFAQEAAEAFQSAPDGIGGVGGGIGGGGFGGGAINGLADGVQATEWRVAGRKQASVDFAQGVPQRQARGFASLEVRMPERGQEFLFTTPRGDLEITARAIDARWIERGLRLAIVLGGGLGLLVVWSLLAAVWRRLGTRLGGLLLVLTGVASVATLMLPVVGMIAVVVGGTLLVASFRRPGAAIA